MKRLTIIQPLLCSLLGILQLSLIVSGQSVLAQEFDDIKQTVSLASYFSSGDYGEDANTNILYFPVSYSVNKGKWLAQLSVPHLQVDGVGNVLVNIGGVSRAVAGSEQQSNGGFGDSSLNALFNFRSPAWWLDRYVFADTRFYDWLCPIAGIGFGHHWYCRKPSTIVARCRLLWCCARQFVDAASAVAGGGFRQQRLSTHICSIECDQRHRRCIGPVCIGLCA